MNKRDLIFLDQMIRKLASPYFVENDLYEYDRLNGPRASQKMIYIRPSNSLKIIIKKPKINELGDYD